MKLIRRIIILSLTLILCSSCTNGNNKADNIDKSALVTEKNSMVSPSKEFILKMSVSEEEGVRGFHVVVSSSKDDEELFKSEEFYRSRDTNYLLWGDNDTIWLYSGDVGVFYWVKTEHTWEKKSYAENKNSIEVPELLKQLRPSLFK
jgi:hypothetical protein